MKRKKPKEIIKVERQSNGDYWAPGPLGSSRLYTGENARILDVLLKYQKPKRTKP